MKFVEVLPIHSEQNLKRWVSETGVWSVRLDAVLFGCRVHVRYLEEPCYLTEYCAGADPEWQRILFEVVVAIMEKFPESIAPSYIQGIWPRYARRPMSNDPFCFAMLCRLAWGEPRPPESAAAAITAAAGSHT